MASVDDSTLTHRVVEDESAKLNDKPVNDQDKSLKPEEENDDLDEPFSELKRTRFWKVLNWVKIKVEAIAWITAACYAIWYTNFFKILFDNENINKLFLNITLLGVGINISLTIYVAIILPYFLRIREDFESYAPRVVQLGAISGFIAFISLIIAIWPIWGWLSFPLVFVMFMGLMMTGHFLPDNILGSLMFGLIFIGACISHHFIEHGGLAHDTTSDNIQEKENSKE